MADFFLGENSWRKLSEPHWDEERAKQHILDAFEYKIDQEWINKLILSYATETAGLLISRWCPYGVVAI